jgi:hypothetical protein
MYGLKRVSQRRDDALSRMGWEQLEILLATYYRGRGYQVDHVGTGASGSQFDGGIDLKLRRDSEYILVQCKHWNAMKVTHNAVHELLGIMVNEGATGAILVTSGEFSKAAIEAGTRQGHVQLIDGEELRAMIGPVPEPAVPTNDFRAAAGSIAAQVGDRLVAAAEDRIRGNRGRGRSNGRVAKVTVTVLVLKTLLPLAFAGLIAFLGFSFIKHVILGLQPVASAHVQPQRLPTPAAAPDQAITEMPSSTVGTGIPCNEVIDAQSGTYIDHCVKAPPPKTLSAAEQRELKRKADEAMKVLMDNTPEM